MPEPTRYYKWLADNGPVYGKGPYAKRRTWQPRITCQLVACRRGYHILTAEQVPLWCGTELIEVRADDVEIVGADKCVCRTWREIDRFVWTPADMVAFAKACARRAAKHARAARDASYASYASYASDASYAARDARDASYAARAARDARAAANWACEASKDYRAERVWQRRWIEKRIGQKLS